MIHPEVENPNVHDPVEMLWWNRARKFDEDWDRTQTRMRCRFAGYDTEWLQRAVAFCWARAKGPEGDLDVARRFQWWATQARLIEMALLTRVHPACAHTEQTAFSLVMGPPLSRGEVFGKSQSSLPFEELTSMHQRATWVWDPLRGTKTRVEGRRR